VRPEVTAKSDITSGIAILGGLPKIAILVG
jgi:hypothetical protein